MTTLEVGREVLDAQGNPAECATNNDRVVLVQSHQNIARKGHYFIFGADVWIYLSRNRLLASTSVENRTHCSLSWK